MYSKLTASDSLDDKFLLSTAEKYRDQELVQDALFLANKDAKIIFASSSVSKYTLQPLDWPGKELFQLFAPEDCSEMEAAFRKALSGEEEVIEINLLLSNGRRRPIHLTAQPILNREHVAGIRGVISDLPSARLISRNMERRAAQLVLLNEIGKNISSALDINQLFIKAVQLMQKGFGYYHIAIFIPEKAEMVAYMTARAGAYANRFPERHSIRFGEGMVGWAWQNQQTFLANDVMSEPAYINYFPDRIPTRSELSVPILAGKEVLGILDIQSPQKSAFTEDDVRVSETVASQLAVALKNAGLYEEILVRLKEKEKIERLLVLQRDLLVSLSAARDFQTAIDSILNLLRPLEVIDCGSIYLLEENGGMRAVAHNGLTPAFQMSVTFLPPYAPKTRFVMAGQAGYFRYEDLARDPRIPGDTRQKENLTGIAELPILYQGVVIANLTLASHAYDTIPPESRSVLEAVASHLGSSIARMKAEAALDKTEAYNRALLQAVPDMLFVLNREGRILDTKREAHPDLYAPPEIILGKKVEEILPLSVSTIIRKCLAKAFYTGETQEVDYHLTLMDGRTGHYAARITLASENTAIAFVRPLNEGTST